MCWYKKNTVTKIQINIIFQVRIKIIKTEKVYSIRYENMLRFINAALDIFLSSGSCNKKVTSSRAAAIVAEFAKKVLILSL